MKERPILFSAPMVLAILDGKKTQTRRVMKPQPLIHDFCEGGKKPALEGEFVRTGMIAVGCDIANQAMRYVNCPYGNKGDQLWVRETFATLSNGDFLPVKPDSINSGSVDIRYRADDPLHDVSADIRGYGWRPSIFMPRWANRITLEITDIRVERLQEINEIDTEAEGIKLIDHNCFENYLVDKNWIYQGMNRNGVHAVENPIMSYASLWESINGIGSWDANPWVWVIEFKRCEHE